MSTILRFDMLMKNKDTSVEALKIFVVEDFSDIIENDGKTGRCDIMLSNYYIVWYVDYLYIFMYLPYRFDMQVGRNNKAASQRMSDSVVYCSLC